jgi:YndJ-like protein/DinB superfamily
MGAVNLSDAGKCESATDSRLEELKQSVEAAMEGMSGEELIWHPPGKWCAAEVLEHLYLSYAGTITGLERVMRKGKPLATQASMAQRVLTSVVVGLRHIPAGLKAPAIVQPKGLPVEEVRNGIGAKIVAMDAIIARCEARFGRRVPLLDHPILGPLNATQWRRLHVVHGRHHLKQLDRLRLRKVQEGSGAEDESVGSWARITATAGAAVWAGIAVLARMGIARVGAIELLFLFAPLVIIPLGMELGRVIVGVGWLGEIARRAQPLGAACAVAAMWMGPGRRAGLLVLGWGIVCLLMAGDGVIDLVSASWGDADRSARATWVSSTWVRITLAIARVDLAVGGAWLVASRLGMRPMGIQEPIGLLTAVHFHYAGFATATIAGATLGFAERRGERRWLRYLVLVVAGLPFVVAAGFVISPALKMGAGVLFALCVAGLAVWLRACAKQAESVTARRLLQVAAGAVFAGMAFAGAYAVADFVGSDLLPIPQMARTHGILNAVGFCLPGLLGWLVESSTQYSVLST